MKRIFWPVMQFAALTIGIVAAMLWIMGMVTITAHISESLGWIVP